jgi:hypothetical protein
VKAGQITARGVFLLRIVGRTGQLVEPAPFAITGGTGPYKNARGEGLQDAPATGTQDPYRFILDIL